MGSAMTPDFDALRAERNSRIDKFLEQVVAEGWRLVRPIRPIDYDACYCACGTGGPCEHDWTGPWFTSEDGCTGSATCARCGMMAFSHSLRNGP